MNFYKKTNPNISKFDTHLEWIKNESIRVTRTIMHNKIRELIWTLFPTIVLIIIAIPSIKLLYLMDYIPLYDEPIITYKVIGHQWYWSYEYFTFINFECPESIDSYMINDDGVKDILGLRLLEVDNPLIVPEQIYLRFLITSVDVLHAWSVPSLGIKVDAVPGRLNQVCLILKRTGEFYGQCSEICGINHGFMPIKVICI